MYYDRTGIKETAKRQLTGRMGNAILVSLLALLLSESLGNIVSFIIRQRKSEIEWIQQIVIAALPLAGILIAGNFLYVTLAGNVIRTGKEGWYLRYGRGEYPSAGELFASFRIYTPCMLTGLLRDLFVFLWSLLFVIPGIVMGYAYSMTGYIIYENPNLSPSRALQISKTMTAGYKGELFVFDLSYLGWNLLSGLTLGLLGVFYVNPYYDAAHAGIYETLRDSALRRGILRPEDFGMPSPPASSPVPPPSAY